MTNARGVAAGRWVMGITGFLIVTFLIFWMAPLFFGNHRFPQYQETETKANLHSIQLALERYAVDNEGPYPLWISGGSYVDGSKGQIDDSLAQDPLIFGSYMPKFPRNPFSRSSTGRQLTSALEQLQQELGDPLGPDTTKSMLPPVYRFGSDYSLMGSVLADPRFAERLAGTDTDGNPVMKRTGADVIYPCWDVEARPDKQYWLQGQFFYKAMGQVIAAGDQQAGELTMPLMQPDMYMLGGFGSVRTKGQDVLGEEQTVTVAGNPDRPLQYWNYTGLEVPGFEQRQASPFGDNTAAGNDDAPFRFGNPNGIADQVIMVLTAGENESMALRERTESESLAIREQNERESMEIRNGTDGK
jgi:hypothetical protein